MTVGRNTFCDLNGPLLWGRLDVPRLNLFLAHPPFFSTTYIGRDAFFPRYFQRRTIFTASKGSLEISSAIYKTHEP
jgi:hypothetical protein